MRTPSRPVAALSAALLLALAACSADDTDNDSQDTGPTTHDGTWPRTVEHAAGETEIPEQPQTVVSTSLSLTGTLLAIDAPVTASAAGDITPRTGDQGFFPQWADVAEERGVEVLYPDLELDLEAIEIMEPDLIIGSVVGADATTDAYDQLSEIAPTVMYDYGSDTWKELAADLGHAIGIEDDAAAVVEEFDTWVAEQAAEVTLPEQPVTALSYNGADGGGVFSASSSQAEVLEDLGFTYVTAPSELVADERTDVSFVTAENLAAAIEEVETLFIIAGDDDIADTAASDPLLANVPAVQADRVEALGEESFRIDYYSATDMVETLVTLYGD